MSAIIIGKRPLQGIKALVRMAIMRSRGLSMMRQPTTPAALQPRPMHIVSACFPQAWQRLKLAVQVKGHARQITQVLQKRKQGEENRHWRQHHRNHPAQHAQHALAQRAYQPWRHAHGAQGVRQSGLQPYKERGKERRRGVRACDGDVKHKGEQQKHSPAGRSGGW